MSQLLVHQYIGPRRASPSRPALPLVLKRITLAPELTEEDLSYRIDKIHKIHEGEYTTAFRASLIGNPSGPLNVVLKTDVNARYPRPDEFRYEAQQYEVTLPLLQGLLIPMCYGLFQATMYNKLVSVLVLQDCGEPIDYRDEALSEAARFSVFRLAEYLHRCGYKHGDIAPRNVLLDSSGGLRLIDLEHLIPHDCGRKMNLTVGDIQPSVMDFGCPELFDVALSLQLWHPRTVCFCGYDIPIHQFTPGNERNIVRVTEQGLRDTVEKQDRLISRARDTIAAVQEVRAEIALVPDKCRVFVRPPSLLEELGQLEADGKLQVLRMYGALERMGEDPGTEGERTV
ncbi:hypothetical protein AB1N83_004105 [Pleurotus pulmonarius]